MSEIDTTIIVGGGIAGTLLGVIVTHYFEERRSRRRIQFRLFDDRRSALKGVYGAMVECYYSLIDAGNHIPETADKYKQGVLEPLEKFETALRKNELWLSSVQDKVVKARGTFWQTGLNIKYQMEPARSGVPPQSHPPPADTAIKWGDLTTNFGEASQASDRALGITALEEIFGGIIGEEPSRGPRSSSLLNRAWGKVKYVVLSLANLGVLYYALILPSLAHWPLIEAVFLGVILSFILVIAFIVKRKQLLKHIATVLTWLGVTLGTIVYSSLQHLTLTVAPLVALDWRVFIVVTVLVANNSMLYSLIEYMRDMRKAPDATRSSPS